MIIKKNRANRILVICVEGIGDVVMAQGIFKFLKYRDATQGIDVVVQYSFQIPLVERMVEVEEIFVLPLDKISFVNIKNLFSLTRKITRKNYHTAIILSRTFKSSLIPFLARIPLRNGFFTLSSFFLKNDIRFRKKNFVKKYPSMIEKYLNLVKKREEEFVDLLPIDKFYPKLERDKEKATTKKFKLCLQNQPILCLCCGGRAFSMKKRWPSIYYAEVAQAKLQENWQVVILGNDQDQKLGAEINELNSNRCVDLTGKTTIDEVINILSLTDLVVSNDTGLMHIAAALNSNLIVIYGASSSKTWPPLTKKAIVLDLDLPCKPCKGSSCPLGHLTCLNGITPDQVLRAIDKFGIKERKKE